MKNCAVHFGVSVRAVREWRRKDDVRWREWQTRQARSAVQMEAMLGHNAAESTPDTETEAARVRFVALQALCDQAVARGDVAGLPVLLKSAEGAQKVLQACRAAGDEWKQRRRELIPAREVHEFVERYMVPIREMIDQGPGEIAQAIGHPKLTEAIAHWFQTRLATLAADAKKNAPCETSH